MSKLPAPCSPIRFVLRVVVVLSMLVFSVANAAPPTFDAVFSPADVGPGNETTLVFTITTDSVQAFRDGAFTNTLPGDLIYATPAKVTSNCTNFSASVEDGGTDLSVSGIEMPLNSLCSVSVRVKTGTSSTYSNVSGDFTSDAGNSGNATASLTVNTGMPHFDLSFTPPAISQGAVSTLTLNIDNFTKTTGFDSWSGTINLSEGLTVAVVPGTTTDCQNTTITANSGNSVISLNGFVAYPADPCSIAVNVLASSLGDLDASISSLNWGSFGDIGQGSALLTVSTAFANFGFDPFVVAPGSSSSLNITLTNRDRISSLTDITFTDDLNTALIGLLATGLPVNNICGSGSSIAGDSLLTFTGGSLAPEASCSFSVPIAVPGTATPGTYTNSSSSFTMNRDGVPVTLAAVSNELQVSAAPVLAMNFVDTVAASGGTTTINYAITNTDTVSAASEIAFSHNLGTTFAGVSIPVLPADGFCGAGSTATATVVLDELILNVANGSLSAGLDCNFSIDILLATGTTGGDFTTATGSISATISETSISGPGASASITIVDGPVLALELPPTAAAPGDQVTATFILTRDSDEPSISGIGFSLNLADALAGLNVASLPTGEVCGIGSEVTQDTNGEIITFAGGTLVAPATSCTFNAVLNVPVAAESGSYSLTTSDVTSTVLGVLVTGSPVTTILEVTNLTATMSFIDDPVAPAPGDAVTLRFDFQNTSATVALQDLSFTMDLGDVIPGLVASGLPLSDICGTGSSISLIGADLLLFNGGSLSSSTACIFDVSVSVPTDAVADTYTAVTSNVSFTENGSNKIISPLTDTLTVDIDEAPGVVITSVLSGVTNVTPIPVTITFNEDVTGFDIADINVTNGNLSDFNPVSASVYTVNITPVVDGTVTLQVPAGSAIDSGSNPNTISPLFSIDFDSAGVVLPTVTIGPPDQALTSAGPVNYAVTYLNASEISLVENAVNLISTGDATATITVTGGTSSTPTVTLSLISGNGTLAISLDAGTARNNAGVVGATDLSIAFDVVNAPPGDADGDGVLDEVDDCPMTESGAAVDANGCSSAQRLEIACPVDGDYKNHGQYVSCVAHEVNAQVGLGLITEEEGDAIVSAAAQSDIGKKMKAASFEASTLILLLMLALARRVRLNRKY